MRKSSLLALLTIGAAFALAPAATAQSAQVRERIQASYLVAFGRTADAGEISYWAKQNPKSVSELVANHRNYLSRDHGTHRATITRSYVDALGRNPTEAEIKYWFSGNDTYAQLMKNHVSWLAGNPAEYEKVIQRSYQFVLRRKPNAAEIKYWKSQGTLSYVMLVACHDEWKKRNGTAAKTSGSASISSNSSMLNSVTVSPAIANEVRATGVIAPGGGNVIAPGGGNVIAPGGGNVIAAGSANVVSAGGLN